MSADLRFDAAGRPYSARYGDHYFSRHGGLAETRHVFLAGNDLPARWRSRERFVIGETGFGTGLNFLATWQAWVDDPQRCQCLHYLSVELHPLSRDELQQTLVAWPELGSLTGELLAVWPEPVPGWHRLHLAGERLTLTLLFGEATAELARLDAAVDAWYLDGFAPDRNPAMWTPKLLRTVAGNTALGGTVATYTVAGAVRRSLQAAGFATIKRAGFAGKREMLSARLEASLPRVRTEPWRRLPAAVAGDRAVVVGAGLAGCAAARAMARRGWRVTLLDRRPAPAAEASGNPAGVVMPRPEAQPSPAGGFYLHAYLYALRLLNRFREAAGWHGCGVLQLAPSAQRRDRYQRFPDAYRLPPTVARWLPAGQAAAVAGIPLDCDALHYPGAGWLAPAGLCRALIGHEAIRYRGGAEVADIECMEGAWRALDAAGAVLAAAPVLVLANANGARRYAATGWLPLAPARGQLSEAAATAASRPLHSVLYGKGYLIPAGDTGRHILGASFASGDADGGLRAEDDTLNLARLERLLPALATALAPTLAGAFAAVRATSPDRLPLIGAVPEREAFRHDYAGLARDAGRTDLPPPRHLPGLYLLTGLGARGITTAPLAAELLAALIAGDPPPLPRELVDGVNPARFIIRDLKRGR